MPLPPSTSRVPRPVAITPPASPRADRTPLYLRLNQLMVVASEHPDRADVALALIQQLAALGLPELALDRLEGLIASHQETTELHALREQLATLRSSQQSGTILAHRASQNMAVLFARGCLSGITLGEAEDAAALWRQTHRAFRDANGNVFFASVNAVSGRLDLEPLVDANEETARFVLPHTTNPDEIYPWPYAFVGTNPIGLIHRVWHETKDACLGYAPKIYILEASLEAFFPALHLLDIREMLADKRVDVFVGPDAGTKLGEMLRLNEDTTVPKYFLTLGHDSQGLGAVAKKYIAEIESARLERCLQLKKDIQDRDANRDAAYWKKRFDSALAKKGEGTGEPLRVLLPITRFSVYLKFACFQTARALRRMGCRVRVTIERDDFQTTTTLRYLRDVHRFDPDLILSIDHLQHEMKEILPQNIPHICWIQDRLASLFQPGVGREVRPLELAVGLLGPDLYENYEYPRDQCVPFLNGTDVHVYDAAPMPEEVLAPYRTDVSFVSNHSQPPDELAAELIQRTATDADARETLTRLLSVVREVFEEGIHEPTCFIHPRHLKVRLARQYGIDVEDQWMKQVFNLIVLPTADRYYRHQTLDWIMAYCQRENRTLRLYGRGWENHAKTKALACGALRNGKDLRAVYQASRVNVHMSIYGSLHQRVFDGFASGGMVLCRAGISDWRGTRNRLILEAMEQQGRTTFPLGEAPDLLAFLQKENPGIPRRGDDSFTARPDVLVTWREPMFPGHFRSFDQLVPDLNAVTFTSEETLGAQLDLLLNDDEKRASIIEMTRERIVNNLSIDALMEQAIPGLHRLIERRAAGAAE